MKILELNRFIFELFGMSALETNRQSRLFRIGSLSISAVIMISLLSQEWFSGLYVIEHFRLGDIDQNLFVVMQIFGVTSTTLSMLSLMCQRKRIRDYFDKLETVVNRCELDYNRNQIDIEVRPSQFSVLSFQTIAVHLSQFISASIPCVRHSSD